jgi:ribosome-associated protein
MKALAIAGAVSDKKGLDTVLIRMKKVSSVCDYFVITSGTSTTHVRAIADYIEEKLLRKSVRLWHSEGQAEASWVVLDYGDVVAHVFLEDKRRFYNLERLWCDAPQEMFSEKTPAKRLKIRRTKAKRVMPKRRRQRGKRKN